MNPLDFLRALRRNRSGVAMTEFAVSLPFFLSAGLWGVETAHFAVTNMKIGQLAAHVADNASRIGDTTTLMNRKLYEEDVTDLLLGADIQGGDQVDLYQHGRVIVSSIEVWDDATIDCSEGGCAGGRKDDGDKFIRWQRCKGQLNEPSAYGSEGTELPSGIGPSGQEVSPEIGAPVIFVEIFYDYQPLIELPWMTTRQITATSAFMVRDKRDMSQVYKRKSDSTPSRCNVYDDFVAVRT
jgi:hypothetical protein